MTNPTHPAPGLSKAQISWLERKRIDPSGHWPKTPDVLEWINSENAMLDAVLAAARAEGPQSVSSSGQEEEEESQSPAPTPALIQLLRDYPTAIKNMPYWEARAQAAEAKVKELEEIYNSLLGEVLEWRGLHRAAESKVKELEAEITFYRNVIKVTERGRRPTTRQRVKDFYFLHPGCLKYECAEALGLDVHTVGRHINAIRKTWKCTNSDQEGTT